MADSLLNRPDDSPTENEREAPSSVPPGKKFVLPANFMRPPWIKALTSIRRLRRVVIGMLMLVLVLGLLGIWTVGRLFAPTAPPLTLAMVTTLSGSQASQGRESLHGAQLYIDAVNKAGGVNGHQLKLVQFDDQFNTSTAPAVAQRVIASRPLLVLGPVYSATALPANSIYRDARMPLITASVSSDLLTQDNPYAFRLRTLTSSQGSTSATYTRQILNLNTASIVYADEPAYGRPIANAFAGTFTRQGGHIAHTLPLAQDAKNYQQTLDTLIATLVSDPQPGIVYLAMTNVRQAGQVIVELRRHGVKAPVLCTDAIDSDLFAASLAATYTEERGQPGYFTDGVLASSPVIYDSAPDEAQAFAARYQQVYTGEFGWFGAKYYEAAQVAVAALRAAQVQGKPASLEEDRAAILRQLAQINSPQTSVEGLDGPVYFDAQHNGASPIRFGQFSRGRLRSLPIQLTTVSNPDLADLAAQERAEEAIKVGAARRLRWHRYKQNQQHQRKRLDLYGRFLPLDALQRTE